MGLFRAAVGAVLAILLGLPAVAHAAPLYTFMDLGSLREDRSSAAYDINELGQVVGFTFKGIYGPREETAFRTAPSARINPMTDALGMEMALAINDHGVVVGTNREGAAFLDPRQGAVTDMGNFRRAGSHSLANGINNAGQIVGYSDIPAPNWPVNQIHHGFRTSSSRPLVASTDDLGVLEDSLRLNGGYSHAFGINAKGQVVGSSITSDGVEAFRTRPNQRMNRATDGLGNLGGYASSANAINSHGQVVGYSLRRVDGILQYHAFRTAPDARINPLTDDLGTIGGAESFAADINDQGAVVGRSLTGGGDTHAFVYFDGEGMLDLNELIANSLPAGWTLAQAEGINNKGQIVGMAYLGPLAPARYRAFLLTPVPEPALTFVPLAALVLAGRPSRSWRLRTPRRSATTV